jgi:signal transduction histidine kinase
MKPNLNAVARDAGGRFYFGTSNGIVVYSTRINKYPQKPVAKIEYISNSNKMVRLDGPLNFAYNQNDLVLNYTAFWYQNPGELSFSHKLENFDDEWIITRDRYATYSNLPPGEYTFKLMVSSNSDFQFQNEVTLGFVINPPFWKRIWFYALTAAVAIYASYLFIRYREQSLVKENQLLEKKVKERFAEILKKNEEIMAQAEEIKSINDNLEKMVRERTEQLELKNKALEEAAFFNSHKLRAPVASLLGLTSLIKRLKLANEDRNYLLHLETSCQKLDDVIKSITSTIDEADTSQPEDSN